MAEELPQEMKDLISKATSDMLDSVMKVMESALAKCKAARDEANPNKTVTLTSAEATVLYRLIMQE